MAGKLTGAFCRVRSPPSASRGPNRFHGAENGPGERGMDARIIAAVRYFSLSARRLSAARCRRLDAGQPSSTKDQHNGHFQRVTNILKRAGWRRAARTRADGRKKRLGRQGHRLQP